MPKTISHLEITTVIGCKNNCTFCPQEKLIRRYKSLYGNKNIVMSLDDFKTIIDKVPLDIRIDFSGFSEPWLNPDCTNMILYAYETGHKNIAVYTTTIGMNINDIQKIEHIPFKIFSLHLPDAYGHMHIDITADYIDKVITLQDSNIKNITYMSMTTMHPELYGITNNFGIPLMVTRANNLQITDNIQDKIEHTNKVTHGKVRCPNLLHGETHNVVLPNGAVALCCMDYNLDHIFGNLLRIPYTDLFKSKEYRNFLAAQDDNSNGFCLCRVCHDAIVLDKTDEE